MCEPITIAALAVSAASAAVGYKGQSDSAKATAKFQGEQYSQTARIANENYVSQIGQTNRRLAEERAAASQQAGADSLTADAARSSAAASLGESGITGNTVQALMDDFSRTEAANRNTLQRNLDMGRQQANQDVQGYYAQAKGNIASATPAPVRMPSALAASLQIGTTALSAYDTYQSRTRRGPYDPNNA